MDENNSNHDGLRLSEPFGAVKKSSWDNFWLKFSQLTLLPIRLRKKIKKSIARNSIGPFDVEWDGMKFRLYPCENHDDRMIFGRDIFPEVDEHSAVLERLHKGSVFVDIGANVGTYSVFVGHHLQGDCTLLAFEPNPRTYAKLIYNMKLNDLSVSNVFNCGVGPKKEMVTLWSDQGGNTGQSSVHRVATTIPEKSTPIEIGIQPLTEVLAKQKIRQIDVLKIDIEGYEDQALVSFFEQAKKGLWPKHVLIEVAHRHLWEVDIVEFMLERGYKESFSTGVNLLLSR